MDPDRVGRILRQTATNVGCPTPVITYTAEGRGVEDAARCVGTAQRNSVYGSGVVNAFAAVTVGR